MKLRSFVITLVNVSTLSAAILFQNIAPAAAVLPVTPANPCGGYTFNPGAIPNYTVTGMNGVVTSLSGNPVDGFTFTFNNPFPDGALYTYTLQLYGLDGSPLYYAPADVQGGLAIISSNSALFGPQGMVWFQVPLEFQGQMSSAKLVVDLNSIGGNMAALGWASAKAPAAGPPPDAGSPGC